ncbi:MAG: HPr kinase/phosphorylase [Gemmobacter sp.]|uniref:HPr kinase/phosphorylase n=1 Tax=Gemmobacter sp. TaxID=1898957 RepID=UPI00391925C2
MPEPTGAPTLHASCVAFGDAGVLILGPSGAGKSALALQLMALGAALVADDRVALRPDGTGGLRAAAPPGLPPLIEARGIGLLRATLQPEARVMLAVDLGQAETRRLPPQRQLLLHDVAVPLVLGPVTGHFPAAIRHYILSGRQD